MLEFVVSVFRHKKFYLLLGGILSLCFFDYLRFIAICRDYSILSEHNSKMLSPRVEGEMIVVLTGDRKRIPVALNLLRERRSPFLLISGAGKGATLTELVNSQEALASKVREVWDHILVESKSTSTIENARESEKIIQKHQIHRIILVTSEYHMLRSMLTFKTLCGGREFIAYPVASEYTSLFNGDLVAFFPAFMKTTVEYWKYFVFRYYFLNQLLTT